MTNYNNSIKNFLVFIYGNYILLDYCGYLVKLFEAPYTILCLASTTRQMAYLISNQWTWKWTWKWHLYFTISTNCGTVKRMRKRCIIHDLLAMQYTKCKSHRYLKNYGLATSPGLLGDAQFQSFLTFRIRLMRVFWGCNLPILLEWPGIRPQHTSGCSSKRRISFPIRNHKLHNQLAYHGEQFLEKPTAA